MGGQPGIPLVSVMAVGYNSFWMWDTIKKKDAIPTFTIGDVYEDFGTPMGKVVTIFVGQFLLFIIFINALTRKLEIQTASYGFWISSVIAIQMVGFLGAVKTVSSVPR